MADKKKALQTFSIEALRKSCMKLFGITTSTFDGAMEGQKGPLTLEAAQQIIEAWKGKAVK
jgi:hypothetical protein